MGDTEEHEFHWADYVVFSLSLALSLGIGFFFACYGKKQSDTKEYLQGGGNMNPVAVGLSIAASLLNAVFLIGVPAEIYYFGMVYSLIGVGWVITSIIAAHVFIPFFRHSSHVSVYEYLGVRFNSVTVRILASLTFSVSIILFMAVVLYAPALAFEAVTGLSIHITQILCGAVCTLYVVMGGLKAVVWTDAVQMIIVMGGTLTIAIMGADKVGGADKVWQIAKDDNRVNYDITDSDPTTRHTIWTQCIGQVFIWLPVYGANQMAIQRYYAVASTFQAQVAMYTSMFVVLIILGMVTMCGLVMYANFRDCDPYQVEGVVDKPDQLFPLLLMRLLGEYHGLPGLYVAAVFAAALSSVSSAVNSLAAVVLEDFIKPIYEMTTGDKQPMTEKSATRISQGLSFCFGLLTIALSYVAPYLGDELIQIPTTIWGSIMAPLFGVFILAMFFPCANASGAVCGLLVTLTFSLWITLGEILYGRDPVAIMPIGFCTDGGGGGNETSDYSNTTGMFTMDMDLTTGTTTPPAPPSLPKTTKEPDLQDFYSVSYAWYGLINLCMSVLIGLVVSWCVDGIYYGCMQKPDTMEADQMFDCASRCCCCLPHRYWHWFRCNIDHDEQAEAMDFNEKPQTNGSKYAPSSEEANAMSFGGAKGQADNPAFMPDSSTSPAPDSQTAF